MENLQLTNPTSNQKFPSKKNLKGNFHWLSRAQPIQPNPTQPKASNPQSHVGSVDQLRPPPQVFKGPVVLGTPGSGNPNIVSLTTKWKTCNLK